MVVYTGVECSTVHICTVWYIVVQYCTMYTAVLCITANVLYLDKYEIVEIIFRVEIIFFLKHIRYIIVFKASYAFNTKQLFGIYPVIELPV